MTVSYRPDVRAMTREAAVAELEHHDCYISLVSGAFVDTTVEEAAWSDPVQVKVTPDPDQRGFVDILFRKVET